ncbi:hypothetical protein [Kitasatospora sp. NPDC059571]|uniref:hypothetical protein n=1 Tax=Kitasatospora sp. NPDC059571 TaxID=3346871 RepID=UPI0036C26F98
MSISANRLGITDVQLYLLSTMEAPGELRQAALRALGADEGTMGERAALVADLLRPQPGMADRLKAVLADARADAAAADEAVDPTEGGAELVRYALPAWPGLLFEVAYDPSGFALSRAGFVRSGPAGDRRAGVASAPTPWSFLKSDLSAGFEQVEEIDVWGHYETWAATEARTGRRLYLRFGWALLQEIGPM